MEPKMTVLDAAAFLNLTPTAIHKRIKTQNLPFKRRQNRLYFGFETSQMLFGLNFKNTIYIFQNIKGGVGKTELTFCVAVRANLYGARILCIDLDLQGNLTKGCFKINPKNLPIMLDVVKDGYPIEDTIVNIMPGLDLIPSNLDNSVLDNALTIARHPLDRVYRDRINSIRDRYDLILIDCPPALTASVTAATLAADAVIAPVTPDEHSLDGFFLLRNSLQDLERLYHTTIPLKVVCNKFDVRNSLSRTFKEELEQSERFSPYRMNCFIRSAQDFPNAINEGLTIFDSFKDTAAKEDIDIFTRELLGIEQTPNLLSIEHTPKLLGIEQAPAHFGSED